jgi:hypothetical protein
LFLVDSVEVVGFSITSTLRLLGWVRGQRTDALQEYQ